MVLSHTLMGIGKPRVPMIKDNKYINKNIIIIFINADKTVYL